MSICPSVIVAMRQELTWILKNVEYRIFEKEYLNYIYEAWVDFFLSAIFSVHENS